MEILQFKEKISLKNKILIIAGISLGIIIISIFTLYVLNENARDWINKYILRKEITEEEVATIELDTDKAQYIYAYDKYIAILCNGKLDIYNNYGVKSQELEIGISNPIFDQNGINLLIAENGGQKVCMISERKSTMGE